MSGAVGGADPEVWLQDQGAAGRSHLRQPAQRHAGQSLRAHPARGTKGTRGMNVFIRFVFRAVL